MFSFLLSFVCRRSRRFDGRLLLQTKFLDTLLAHDVFLNFSCDSHREGVNEFEIAWNLEVGDLYFNIRIATICFSTSTLDIIFNSQKATRIVSRPAHSFCPTFAKLHHPLMSFILRTLSNYY